MPEEITTWIENYLSEINNTIKTVSNYLIGYASHRSTIVKGIVKSKFSEFETTETLSQIAIRALRNTPGVDCILVGAREESYVNDILIEMKEEAKKTFLDEKWIQITATVNDQIENTK